SGIAIQRDTLWSRFKRAGVRVPLNLEGVDRTDTFLQALFGSRENGASAPALLAAATESDPLDAWLIESHDALQSLCDTRSGATSAGPLTGLSYDRLRPYRDELTRALNRKIQSGVESPPSYRRGSDNQRRPLSRPMPQDGQPLNGLPQSHLVGQARAGAPAHHPPPPCHAR